jgi:hypothetical protein
MVATQQAPATAAQARRPRGELAAYGLLVAAALALRLLDLGDRPFHHDESRTRTSRTSSSPTATTSTTRCCTGRCAST